MKLKFVDRKNQNNELKDPLICISSSEHGRELTQPLKPALKPGWQEIQPTNGVFLPSLAPGIPGLSQFS